MIERGDLVVVVHECCSMAGGAGAIFQVGHIGYRNVLCDRCGFMAMNARIAWPAGRCRIEHSPVSWLKKIDPLAEEQLTEGVESVDAQG